MKCCDGDSLIHCAGHIWSCKVCGCLLISTDSPRISGGETVERDGHLRQTVNELPRSLREWQGD